MISKESLKTVMNAATSDRVCKNSEKKEVRCVSGFHNFFLRSTLTLLLPVFLFKTCKKLREGIALGMS